MEEEEEEEEEEEQHWTTGAWPPFLLLDATLEAFTNVALAITCCLKAE